MIEDIAAAALVIGATIGTAGFCASIGLPWITIACAAGVAANFAVLLMRAGDRRR